jgi:predicted permease
MDYVVVGYVTAICVLTGTLFGLAPIFHVSRTNLNDALKENGRGTAGNRRVRWFSGTMVVVELTLTVVLLAGAGLMLRSFMKLYTLDIGISTEHLMTMKMQLPSEKYTTPEARRAFYERLEPRLASIPGVESVAITTSVPPLEATERGVEIDGRPAAAPEERMLFVDTVTISPSFFDALRVRLLRGRRFREMDGAAGAEAVIVNERFVRQFFPGDDPIGRRIRFVERQAAGGRRAGVWHTIVGISPSLRHGSLREDELNAVAYVPYRHDPPSGPSLLVRSQLPPASVMDAVRREVRAIDRDQPVFTMQTLEQMLAQSRWPFRVFGSLFTIFAVIALVLSSVGLYAVMAYSVAQRTQEIGVRMALGAVGRQMSWLVLERGLEQLAMGLILGLVLALAMTRVLRRVLVQISPTDPVTFAAITILLAVVSVAACLLPARRATRVDPLIALRAE